MEALFVALMRTGLSVLASLHERWRNVRVTVHRGYLQGDSREQFFITVTNLSPKREVEVTRVWFAVTPTVEAMAKPLPQRLKPDESWATYVTVASLPMLELPYAEVRARARLSSGNEIRSRATKDPAPYGYIPGATHRQ